MHSEQHQEEQAQHPEPAVQHVRSTSSEQLAFNQQYVQQTQGQRTPDLLQRQLHAQTMAGAQGSDDRSVHPSRHHSHNNNDELDQLALLAHQLKPYAIQGPPSHSPTGTLGGFPTGASGSINPPLQPTDDGETSGSHGTLMLSKGGRSKYLGPTAGSEWLKDVCHRTLKTLD